MRLLFTLLVTITLSFPACNAKRVVISAPRKTITAEQFGEIEVYTPESYDRSAIVFVSRNSAQHDLVVAELTDKEVLTFVIDPESYISALKALPDSCLVIGGSIERLNQSLQSTLKVENFSRALIVGIDQGALLALVAQLQSPDRFAGTLAVQGCLLSPLNFCPTSSLSSVKQGDLFRVTLQTGSESWPQLMVGLKDGERSCGDPSMLSSLNQSERPGASLPADIAALLSGAQSRTSDDEIVELYSGADSPLALFFSGDGGWAGIDEDTGEFLRSNGLNVVGVSSLRHFWSRKTPKETAQMAADLLNKYQKSWGPSKIYLIGYSLGADVIPLIYNRLPQDLKSRVQRVVMIAPEEKADLEVEISDWLGVDDSDSGIALKPEVDQIPVDKVLCIYGDDDDDGLCQVLDKSRFKTIGLSGDHHFDGEYEAVGETILKNLGGAGNARLGEVITNPISRLND